MNLLRLLLFVVVLVSTIFLMKKEKESLAEGQVSNDALTTKQKVMIWVLCFLDPVITGAIFYYGWRKRLPVKAKQANHISLWAFFILFLAVVIVIVIRDGTGVLNKNADIPVSTKNSDSPVEQVLNKEVEVLKQERNEAVMKRNEAAAKSFISGLTVDLDDWYVAHKTYEGFADDPVSQNKINGYLGALKEKANYDEEHVIYTTKNDYVIKIRAKGDDAYYCSELFLILNNKPVDQMIKLVQNAENDFMSKTNCIHKPLSN